MPGIGLVLGGGPIARGGGWCKTGTSAVLALAAVLPFAFASLFRPRNERHMELRDEPLPLLVRSFVNGGARPSVYETSLKLRACNMYGKQALMRTGDCVSGALRRMLTGGLLGGNGTP
jgi:hypothetical protein